MPFEWLDDFHKEMDKRPDYAEKTLAAYKLGMNAKGSIVGVYLQAGPTCPDTAAKYAPDTIFHPDDAPRVPLEICGSNCQCVYRPVMAYQVDEATAERLTAEAAERKAAARKNRKPGKE